MNLQEFSTEFDVLYSNITSNQAPGINEYEKSVFLTKAQSQLVNEYFNNRTDGVGGGFDGSQKRQYDFSGLIRTAKLYNVNSFQERVGAIEKIDKRSKVFLFPQNYFLAVNEILSDDKWQYSVVPISYIEYQRLMLKPYNFPVKRAAWRLLSGKKRCNYANSVFDTDDETAEYTIQSSWTNQNRNIQLCIRVHDWSEEEVKSGVPEADSTYGTFNQGPTYQHRIAAATKWLNDKETYGICIDIDSSNIVLGEVEDNTNTDNNTDSDTNTDNTDNNNPAIIGDNDPNNPEDYTDIGKAEGGDDENNPDNGGEISGSTNENDGDIVEDNQGTTDNTESPDINNNTDNNEGLEPGERLEGDAPDSEEDNSDNNSGNDDSGNNSDTGSDNSDKLDNGESTEDKSDTDNTGSDNTDNTSNSPKTEDEDNTGVRQEGDAPEYSEDDDPDSNNSENSSSTSILKDDYSVIQFLKEYSKKMYDSIDTSNKLSKALRCMDGFIQCYAPTGFNLFFGSFGGTIKTEVVEVPTAEIIGKFNGELDYQIRYIPTLTPIILEDLTNYGTDITIGGKYEQTECILPIETHQEILERAVTLAKIAWQGGTATQAAAQQSNNNN